MKIAITGGTGRIGGRVARLLEGAARHEVVALSRRDAPYDDPSALRAALDGVDTMVFVSSDGEAAQVIVHHRNVLRAAIECEVGHVVLLSGVDVSPDSPFCYAYTNRDIERLLKDGGRPYSVVRAGLFAEFFLSVMRQAGAGRPDGVVALPAAGGRLAPVAREDVARCLAALALGEPTYRHHDVTGPESMPVAEIAAAAGYRYTDTTATEYACMLHRLGEEPWWIYAYSTMFDSIRQGRWERTSDAVADLTGRPPIPLAQVVTQRHDPSAT